MRFNVLDSQTRDSMTKAPIDVQSNESVSTSFFKEKFVVSA